MSLLIRNACSTTLFAGLGVRFMNRALNMWNSPPKFSQKIPNDSKAKQTSVKLAHIFATTSMFIIATSAFIMSGACFHQMIKGSDRLYTTSAPIYEPLFYLGKTGLGLLFAACVLSIYGKSWQRN